jgi:cob(I)alamin adenosyltransferase
MGSILAHPDRSAELARKTGDELPFSARPLEEAIDALSERLPALRSFVLPGGHPAAAALQVARAVCRRVERRAVLVQSSQPVPEGVIVYLNRLSDFLFVAARWVGHFTGQQDVIWQPRQERRKG